jgi:hypothetical protein
MRNKQQMFSDVNYILFKTRNVIAYSKKKSDGNVDVMVDGKMKRYTKEEIIELANHRFAYHAMFAECKKGKRFRGIVNGKYMESNTFGKLLDKAVKKLDKAGILDSIIQRTEMELELIGLVNELED